MTYRENMVPFISRIRVPEHCAKARVWSRNGLCQKQNKKNRSFWHEHGPKKLTNNNNKYRVIRFASFFVCLMIDNIILRTVNSPLNA